MKNVITTLAKSVSIPLGLTAVASTAHAGIHQKMLGSGRSSAPKTTTLTISSDKMKNIIKIVKSLKDFDLLLKGVNGTIQNEARKQIVGFLSMLLCTLSTSLLENILVAKGINTAGERVIMKRQG